MRLRYTLLFALALAALAVVLPALRPAPAHAAGSVAFSDARYGWRVTVEGFTSLKRPGQAVLWRTANGGETWRKVKSGKPGLAGDATVTPGIIALHGSTKGLWGRTFWDNSDLPWLRAVDGGASWKAAPNPVRDNLADIGFASARVVWACDYAGGSLAGGAISKSTDGGVTWKTSLRVAAKPAATSGEAFVALDAPTAATCYVAGRGQRLGGLWRTGDGGRSWLRRPVPGGGAVAIAFPSASTGWMLSPSGAVSRTSDGGLTWTTQLASTGRHLSSIVFTDLEHGWAAGEEGAMARTTDGGATWKWLDTGTESWLRELVFIDATHGWATYEDFTDPVAPADVLLRTTDGGATWAPLY